MNQNDLLLRYAEEKWQNAGIEDDFIFGKVMETRPDLLQQLLQACLPEIRIKSIRLIERQKDIKEDRDAKGIRIDVYVTDMDGRVYQVEMQCRNTGDLPKRMRYDGAMIDLQLLEPGDTYELLNETYIIYICPFDLFDKGLRKYTFHQVCDEDGDVRLEDGMTKIVLNASGTNGDIPADLQALFDLIRRRGTENRFGKDVEKAVSEIKRSKEWRKDFMTFEMKLHDERKFAYQEGEKAGEKRGEKRGEKIGRQKERQDIIASILKAGKSPEQIAEFIGIPLEDVLAVRT